MTAPLDVLRTRVEQDAPLGPVHAALHSRLTAIEPGEARGRMPTAERDRVLDAVLVLADFVLGLALTSTVAPGERITTVHLAVSLTGDHHSGTELSAHGTLESRVGSVGTSTATISDGGGPVARASARNAVLTDDLAVDYGGDVPSWSARPGPWALLVPVRIEHSDDDGALLTAHPDPALANTAGAVQGGALAGIAARALTTGLGVAPQEIDVTLLRAVPADGHALSCRATVEHAGRRLRSGRAELRDRTGRLVLTASGMGYVP